MQRRSFVTSQLGLLPRRRLELPREQRQPELTIGIRVVVQPDHAPASPHLQLYTLTNPQPKTLSLSDDKHGKGYRGKFGATTLSVLTASA